MYKPLKYCAMDLHKRNQYRQFATWLNNNDYLTERVQLIPYELSEMYLESDYYKQLNECEGKQSKQSSSDCVLPVVINWVACADTHPNPSEKPKYLADTGNEVIQCGFSEKDAGIWPNVKQWCNVPKPPCL